MYQARSRSSITINAWGLQSLDNGYHQVSPGRLPDPDNGTADLDLYNPIVRTRRRCLANHGHEHRLVTGGILLASTA